MKVILLEDVKKVGKKGDVVKVSDGYGQNFLIKNKLAVRETAGSKKILDHQIEEKAKQDEIDKQNAIALKDKIEAITLEFLMKTGKDGRTFGNISTKHIVEDLREIHGIRVDKRKFIDARPVGALGYTKLKVELYKGVIATITIHLKEK